MKLSAYYFGRMEQMGCKYGRLRKEGKYCGVLYENRLKESGYLDINNLIIPKNA